MITNEIIHGIVYLILCLVIVNERLEHKQRRAPRFYANLICHGLLAFSSLFNVFTEHTLMPHQQAEEIQLSPADRSPYEP